MTLKRTDNHAAELITPEEAATLSIRFGELESIQRALSIYAAFIAEAAMLGYDEDYLRKCALATIYDAGRIQGIREQRSNRRKHATTNS